MNMYHGIDALPDTPLEPVVTLGNFDGVHRGHRAILARVREEAARIGAPTMVISFHPNPRNVLRPETPVETITSTRSKLRELWDLKIDHCLIIPFDHTMAETTAQEFVEEVLWDALKIQGIYVGPFVSFGHQRGGDLRFLMASGLRLGFRVGMVDPVVVDGQRVSSSAIRQAIKQGDLNLATRFLGRHHRIVGVVREGDKRGRELGFPTANLVHDQSILPPHGVYAAWADLPTGRHPAVVNVGVRPTFEAGPSVEGHVIGWEGDLYDEEISFTLVQSIRAEVRFPDGLSLKRQIKRDVIEARRCLGLLRK